MDGQQFDALTKAVGAGVSRRQVLRRIGGGLAGGALAMLGLGEAVRAQDELVSPPCSICRQCINMFVARCISTCVGSGLFAPETCAEACCEGSRNVCTVLGECSATCTAPCPGD